jgi:hypothetical protein
VFANVDAAEKWFEENDPEGVAFEYRGARGDLESARSLIVMSGLTRIPNSRWTLHHVRKVPKPEVFNGLGHVPLET